MGITEKLRELIPDGYGYNSEFAHTMEAAAVEIERLRQGSDVLHAQINSLSDGMRNVFPAAHRLALELECLLLSCTDTAATAKWWESANEALEQWREFCREDTKTLNVELWGERSESHTNAVLGTVANGGADGTG